MDVLREIKRQRELLKLKSFLNSLYIYHDGDPNSNYYGYYEKSNDYTYILINITLRDLDISKRFREYGLSDEDIISVIGKFTRRFNYKISWVD